MRLINLRPYRGPLLLLAIILSLWGLGMVRVTTATSYAQSDLISGLWGSGPLEFGRGVDIIGREQGPCAMDVNAQGVIVVADTHNQRVLRFGPDGQPDRNWRAQALAGFAVTGVALDGRGQVYAADTARGLVICLDASGAEIARVSLIEDEASGDWTLCGIAGHQQSGAYGLLAGWAAGGAIARVVHYDPRSGKVSEIIQYTIAPSGAQVSSTDGEAAAMPADFCVGPGGRLVLSFRSGLFGLRLVVIDSRGTTIWTRDISRERMIRRAVLLGMDSKGRVYAAIDYGEGAEALSVTSKGEPVHVAAFPSFRPSPAPGSSVPYSLLPGRVDLRGRLYLVTSTGDRYSLVRLVPRSLPNLRWWSR